MSKFEDYVNKYQTIRMERRNGILQMTLHTDGGSLRWGFLPHSELPDAFYDVGADRENRVVILTGTGPEFSGPRATPGTSSFPSRPSIERIDRIHWEGRHLLMKLLDIEVPVISAINGPAWRHSEIPLLCDIVLAADTAQFQDSAHFPSDVVPGDGMHIVYPLLLGMNRGRYFLLTGQTLTAQQALDLGEKLPAWWTYLSGSSACGRTSAQRAFGIRRCTCSAILRGWMSLLPGIISVGVRIALSRFSLIPRVRYGPSKRA